MISSYSEIENLIDLGEYQFCLIIIYSIFNCDNYDDIEYNEWYVILFQDHQI